MNHLIDRVANSIRERAMPCEFVQTIERRVAAASAAFAFNQIDHSPTMNGERNNVVSDLSADRIL